MSTKVFPIDLEVSDGFYFYRIDDLVIKTDTWDRRGKDCVLGLGLKGKAPIIMNYLLNHPELARGRSVFEPFAGAGPYGFTALKLGASRCDLLDVNPRAAAFMRESAELNGFDRSRYNIIEKDFNEFHPPSKYDLILANPPYLPTPELEDVPVHSNGGNDGSLFARMLLEKLDTLLTPDGQAIIGTLQVESRMGPILMPHIDKCIRDRQVEMMRMSDAYIDFRLIVQEIIDTRPEKEKAVMAWYSVLKNMYGNDLVINWYIIRIGQKGSYQNECFIADFDETIYGTDYAPEHIVDHRKWVEALIRFEMNR